MKYLIFSFIVIFLTSLVFAQGNTERLEIYSISTPFYGKEMVVSFYYDEIIDTPICKTSDKEFPIKQSDAISKALDWAEKEFDPSIDWQVDSVSLKFISIENQHALYIIELRPKKEMQSLNVGLLMNGNLIAPVAKTK